MYLPTDYQLQINVILYDINSARIYFTKDFWTTYSDQLIKDYRRETGLVLNDRKKFLAKIKRALFKYYYLKIVQQKKTQDLYSSVISIFHEFSHNSLPKKVTNIDDIPIYYEDEWKLDDPLDVPLDDQSDVLSKAESSMSDILLAHESVSRREYDINKEHEDLADTFLNQFFNEKINLDRLKQDYNEGTLQQYFLETGAVDMTMKIDNVFKIVEHIYQHYNGEIGMVTIFNAISLQGIDLKTTIRSERRFDLWMKVYQQFNVFRALVNYIGTDICENLYHHFLSKISFQYFNGYHYVFNSFIIHDFIKRSYIRKSPLQFSSFINLDSEYREINKSRVFNSFRNSKTNTFDSVRPAGNAFGVTKATSIFGGKGLTNTDQNVKPINKSALGFGSANSSTSTGFQFVKKEVLSDSD